MNSHRATIAALLSLASLTAFAQNAPKPEFEVATIRPSSPDAILDSFVPALNLPAGATLRIVNRQLKELIMIAWGIGGRQLAGPQWLISPAAAPGDIQRFDVVAKVPSGAASADVPAMMQNLLQDRFKLRLHHEQRAVSIYALGLAKEGLQLKPVTGADQVQSGCQRNLFGDDGITRANCRAMTAAQLAQQLQTLAPGYFTQGPVIDQTGLTGIYDFPLAWITQQQRLEGQEGPSMFDAIDKLGLHIEQKKGDADVLVVDEAEPKPSSN